jgi:mRNA interferase RelE/StbE
MIFKIHVEKRAAKELKKLPHEVQDKIRAGLRIISLNPFPHKNNPKKLKGGMGYRFRIGHYKALYEIEDQKVVIYNICHRKDAYKT